MRARLVTPLGVHLAGLAVASAVSIAFAARMWFFSDDFSLLVDSLGDPLAPHVGHWNTGPFLLFRGIRALAGLESALPFAIPVIVAHAALVHLIWRLMVRTGSRPWIATAFGLLLSFFGGGAENIAWPFQIGFVGAMALCCGALLLLLRERRSVLVAATIVLLTVVAVTFSGTALPLLVVLAAGALVRRDPRGLALLLPAVVAYAVWWFLIAREQPAGTRASGLGDLLSGVPTYALTMLTDGVGRIMPVAVLGPLAMTALTVWWILSIRMAPRTALPAYLLALAAPIFALLTGFTRVHAGLETATSSRYLYFVVMVTVPLAGLAVSRLIETGRLRTGAATVLIGILALYNAGGLVATLLDRVAVTHQTRVTLAAAQDLARDAAGRLDPTIRPDVANALDVQLGDLLTWGDAGWFGGHDDDPVLRATLIGRIAVSAVDAAEVPVAACAPVTAGETSVPLDARTVLRSATPVDVTVTVRSGGVDGEGRVWNLGAGATRFEAGIPGARIMLTATTTDVEVCRAVS